MSQLLVGLGFGIGGLRSRSQIASHYIRWLVSGRCVTQIAKIHQDVKNDRCGGKERLIRAKNFS